MWRLCGKNFLSDYVFESPVPHGEGLPDFCHEHSNTPLWSNETWRGVQKINSGATHTPVEVHRGDAEYWLNVNNKTNYIVRKNEILSFTKFPEDRLINEINFLDIAFPAYLELIGIPVLHASAVSIGGVAIVFIAPSGGGKSSIAARMTQFGAKFLTDDVFPISIDKEQFSTWAYYPQIRLWPDASSIIFKADQCDLICERWPKNRIVLDDCRIEELEVKLPIGAIYIVEPIIDSAEFGILPLDGHAAPMMLLRNAPAFAMLDLETRVDRTKTLVELSRIIPIRILKYPKRYELLDSVINILFEDFNYLGIY